MKKAVFFDEDGPSFVAEDMNSRRKDVYRTHSPRFYESHRESPHFLQSCFLCKKTLSAHKDIFMYRGDKPFCSEDCRQEQIDIDDTKERMRNLSLKSSSRKEKAKSENYSSRTETMVAG